MKNLIALGMTVIQTSAIRFFIHTSKKRKQVAQKATIAHLSPMCQGQSAPKLYAAFPPP